MIEVGATVVAAIVAVVAYFWPRRPAEDTAPILERTSIAPVVGHPKWMSISALAINREACGWTVEAARALNPIGAKIALESSVPTLPREPWDPPLHAPDAEFLAGLSNSVTINYPLAHAGRCTNSNIRGENDREMIYLWVHLPRSDDEFRIEFTFRSNDTSQRVKSRELSASTTPNTSIETH